jgi:hypothetical protein
MVMTEKKDSNKKGMVAVMKRAVLLLILGIGIVFSIQSTVSATTDPPHNESSGV